MAVHPELIALARASRAVMVLPLLRPLLRNPLYRAHVGRLQDTRHLDVLTRRRYLSAHLGVRRRVAAAAAHYRDQVERFDPAYAHAVYHDGGLVLWERRSETATYALRLQAGNDVLNEGGLSIVLFVGAERVAVCSFSYLDGPDVGLPEGRRIFVGRLQQSPDRGYQADFHRDLHHSVPVRLLLAALSGIAVLDGADRVAVVTALTHPNYKPEFDAGMHRSYDETVLALGATRHGPVFHLPVPLRFPPIEEVSRKKRPRARARRALLAEIAEATETVLRAHLREPTATR